MMKFDNSRFEESSILKYEEEESFTEENKNNADSFFKEEDYCTRKLRFKPILEKESLLTADNAIAKNPLIEEEFKSKISQPMPQI